MMQWMVVVAVSVLTSMAAETSGYMLTADLNDKARAYLSHEGTEHGGWSIEAEVTYFAKIPRVVVKGRYVTRQAIEPTSLLSYHILDDTNEMLLREGRRFEWGQTTTGALRADFEIEIHQVLREPTLRSVRVGFDAVMEHQYWYRNQYPEIPFPEILITNLPRRDHYTPGWFWLPRFLPAGFAADIPAVFSVGYQADAKRFVPALDVESTDTYISAMRLSVEYPELGGLTRVPSKRIAMTEPLDQHYRGWMPLESQDCGTLLVRPGLVWENVRWYRANDWFQPRPVTFISPYVYVVIVWIFGMVLGWWFTRVDRIKQPWRRRTAGALWALFLLWFTAQMWVSGFWMVALLWAVLWWGNAGVERGNATRTYVLSWVWMVFLEGYWGRLEASAGTTVGGLWISIAGWAILLLPLLIIRQRHVRSMVALGGTLVWTIATIVGVVYFEFFRDFPAVESLLYAAQIGELGDSIISLVQPAHALPLVVWTLGMLTCVLARFNGIPKSRTRSI